MNALAAEPQPDDAFDDAIPTVTQAFELDGKSVQRSLTVGDVTFTASRRLTTGVRVARADLPGAWWRSYLVGERIKPDERRGSLRFAELFAGSGGLAVGFSEAASQLGYRTRSQAALDLDAEGLQVYRRQHETRHVTAGSATGIVSFDVRGTGEGCAFIEDRQPRLIDENWAALLGKVDVLLAGPPCQGHSSLNNHTRHEDPRNRLYLTVPATAIALQVPVVIIENVRSVLRDRSEVVESAKALFHRAGYSTSQGVLKAAELGWPQSRERFFLIARRDGSPLDPEVVGRQLAVPARDVEWAIGDLRDLPEDDFMHCQPQMSTENSKRIGYLFEKDVYELPLAERPECHQDGTTYGSVYGRMYPDQPAPTITTGFMTMGRGRFTHYDQPRVINPHEAARLQGFPDDYDFRLKDGSTPSKSKLAKWIGDAVPMPLGFTASIAALCGTEGPT